MADERTYEQRLTNTIIICQFGETKYKEIATRAKAAAIKITGISF
ncbi:MAG: hypothetical protein ACI4MB_01825 [Candidatus Coproplasma sp.]